MLAVEKVCSGCGESKSLDEFHKNSKSLDERQSACKSCQIERNQKWSAANKDYKKQRDRQWYTTNKDQINSRRRTLRYGLTEDQYQSMIRDQAGCCGICNQLTETLVVDHCHNTGDVRGLLCNRCNINLGGLGDTIESVRAALRYLERSVR